MGRMSEFNGDDDMPEFSRPFGTYATSNLDPNVKALGYSRVSLRDKDSFSRSQILVALDRNVRAPR
jgi:hypothetical protein